MNVIRNVREMQEASASVKRAGRRIALVPTMGALHDGHVALIRAAREQNAAVVVSIYINPAQFAPNEDFKQYPRNLEADVAVCEREKVDAAFAPFDDEIYPARSGVDATGTGALPASTWIEETAFSTRLEGHRRPGYLRGVCTVVAKLFNIVQPDVAMFGQKDYQQLKVVERMVRDLWFPVRVVAVPTVREPDGLALSSRNAYLDAGERAQATVLFKALSVAQDLFNEGENNPHRLESAMVRAVSLAPAARIDYAEIADAVTLEPKHEAKRGDIALLAAYIGKTRLIDNLIL